MNVFLDIETIPCQAPGVVEQLAAEVQAPATHKRPESIKAWLDENRQAVATEQWLKTSFDGGVGQIVCVSWAFDQGDTRALQVADLSPQSEAALLEVWFSDLSKAFKGTSGTRPCLVGHNHVSFDIPFVWKRAIVLGIKPPFWFPRDPKPWSDTTFDTMTAWAGARDRISLDRLCKLLSIPGKDGMTGADVWPMVQAGRLDEVAEYCRADVERVRSIWRRINFTDGLAR
tara:strand:+ start:404 stop:1090 length:687 start_codon:yes stop_codon:yes gene_type:complete